MPQQKGPGFFAKYWYLIVGALVIILFAVLAYYALTYQPA